MLSALFPGDNTLSKVRGMSWQVELRQETHHRPMDLRAATTRMHSRPAPAACDAGLPEPDWEIALKIASSIGAEARAAVKVHGCY